MSQVIKTHKFTFRDKTLSQAAAIEFENDVSSAFVMLRGFAQKFSDGENVKTASAYVEITAIDRNLVDLNAVLDIQPTNNKSREGWIEAVLIAEVAEN